MFAVVFALCPSQPSKITVQPPLPPAGPRISSAVRRQVSRCPLLGRGVAVRLNDLGSGGGGGAGGRRERSLSRASLSMASPGVDHLAHDVFASVLTSAAALALLRFWEELARRRVFDQKLSRKLVHISVGLVFMLFWPIFSSASQAPFLAALAPGVNIIRMILLGLGIMRNDAIVKSMSRTGDHRELLKGPLYYACTLTVATAYFWRTSPIAIAAVCNLCAGDGVADIIGRRFGKQKLPYNHDKSFMGSIAMALAGFIASVVYMHYFSCFGFIEESWQLGLGFLVVSIISAVVESLPISTKLDDNLTVTLASIFMGSLFL